MSRCFSQTLLLRSPSCRPPIEFVVWPWMRLNMDRSSWMQQLFVGHRWSPARWSVTIQHDVCRLEPVNSKETGTIPASRILKPLWRLTCRSSPVLLNNEALQHSRVFAIHGCPQRPYKFGFTQSYGRSYGGIVPVFIEFTVWSLRPLTFAIVSRCLLLHVGLVAFN